MKRWCLIILVMVIFFWRQESHAQPQATATIQGFQFSPSPLPINLGESVTWTNLDQASHTVTSDESGMFNSGTLGFQQTFTFTPTTTGSITYHCNFHPSMQGAIVVLPPMDQVIYIPSVIK